MPEASLAEWIERGGSLALLAFLFLRLDARLERLTEKIEGFSREMHELGKQLAVLRAARDD